MASKKLSESEIREIPDVLRRKKWTREDAAKKLSQEITKNFLEPYIKRERGTLSIETIGHLIDNSELQYNGFNKIRDDKTRRGVETLSKEEIEDSIELKDLFWRGFSVTTCEKFLVGEETIKFPPYKMLYEVFFERPYSDRSRLNKVELEGNDRKYKLRKSFGDFNHYDQKQSFRKLINGTCQRLGIFLDLSEFTNTRPCEVKWLLKCILKESTHENHLVIHFKFSQAVFKSFPKEIHEIIKQELKSQKMCTFSPRIKKSSSIKEIADAINCLLEVIHLIFIFEDQGIDINRQILTCFKQYLPNSIQPFQNYLIICCFFNNPDQSTLKLKPTQGFGQEHLKNWIAQSQDLGDLFDISGGESEIPAKVEEIWNKATEIQQDILVEESSGLRPNALLKAIYQSCNCEWDEEWDTWQTPTL
ncbi:MAG TPA: hypothetical protein V6D21_22080 [Candidatus Obscuribacterales bacterium]